MGRPAPTFWWDFWYGGADSPVGVVVQSDRPGGMSLAVFKSAQAAGPLDVPIAQAQALIEDFKAGRKTPHWGVVAG